MFQSSTRIVAQATEKGFDKIATELLEAFPDQSHSFQLLNKLRGGQHKLFSDFLPVSIAALPNTDEGKLGLSALTEVCQKFAGVAEKARKIGGVLGPSKVYFLNHVLLFNALRLKVCEVLSTMVATSFKPVAENPIQWFKETSPKFLQVGRALSEFRTFHEQVKCDKDTKITLKTNFHKDSNFTWGNVTTAVTLADSFCAELMRHFVKEFEATKLKAQNDIQSLYARVNPKGSFKETLVIKPSSQAIDSVLFQQESISINKMNMT